jgi:hypothetical protein
MKEQEALSRLVGMKLSVFKARRSVAELILLARSLKSEDGENVEYDRALVELVSEAALVGAEDRMAIGRLIGVKETT